MTEKLFIKKHQNKENAKSLCFSSDLYPAFPTKWNRILAQAPVKPFSTICRLAGSSKLVHKNLNNWKFGFKNSGGWEKTQDVLKLFQMWWS